jgi:hypothetical protein
MSTKTKTHLTVRGKQSRYCVKDEVFLIWKIVWGVSGGWEVYVVQVCGGKEALQPGVPIHNRLGGALFSLALCMPRLSL